MRISSLEVVGSRGCPDGTYAFEQSGEPRALTMITGPEACGKTSLLEAIVVAKEMVGPYGVVPSIASCRAVGAPVTSLRATWRLHPDERRGVDTTDEAVTTSVRIDGGGGLIIEAARGLGAIFGRYAFEPDQPKAEYFPARRELGAPAFPLALPAEHGSFHDRLAATDTKYAWVPTFISAEERRHALTVAQRTAAEGISLGGELSDFRQRFNKHLAAFCPQLRFTGARETPNGPEPIFARRDGPELTRRQLSASEQQAVLFIGATLHLGLGASLVLIDEPELHQHPAAHVRVLEALRSLGPNQQLIVATSSEAMLRAAPADSILQLRPPANA